MPFEALQPDGEGCDNTRSWFNFRPGLQDAGITISDEAHALLSQFMLVSLSDLVIAYK